MSHPKLRLVLLPAAVAIAVGAAGCDVQENANLTNGEKLFTSKCGGCHTLARAGSQGKIGPNLDNAFAQSRKDGMDRDTVEGVVGRQIRFPDGDEMPANLVTGDNASDVAAFVGRWAGLPGVKPSNPLLASNDPGARVFAGQGCGSCHQLAAAGSQGQVGPNLDESLKGKEAGFVKTSIVDPNAEIEEGFSPNQMPGNYGKSLSAADIDALVKFILKSVKGQGAGGSSKPGGR